MSDIFVSYSAKDRATVGLIVRELERHGVRTFWDVHIDPGQSWQDTLQNHLVASKAIVVVWSPNAAESEWVRSEAEFALSNKKYVPINLGDRFSVPVPFDRYKTPTWEHGRHLEVVGEIVSALRKFGVDTVSTPAEAPASEVPVVPNSKGYAFISHVEEDVPVVTKISGFLRTREYSYWTYHESDRDYQKPTVLEIEERMLECALILSVISPEWKRSEWTQRELAFAREIKKPLFHLRFRNPCPTLAIAGDTYFDFETGEEVAFGRLGRELDKKRL